MSPKVGRYSGYIRPFSYAVDLLLINCVAYFFLPKGLNTLSFHFFISVTWIILAWNLAFYEVYRFTKEFQIIGKLFRQYLLFLIFNFAYLGFFYKFSEPSQMIKYISLSLVLVAFEKFSVYLSSRLNYSYTYLANIFKKLNGIPIEQFLITEKIRKVKMLLISEQLTLSEIAYKMHYSSVAHLSTQFKKITGIRVSDFKLMNKEASIEMPGLIPV